jgi:hypothetical protein
MTGEGKPCPPLLQMEKELKRSLKWYNKCILHVCILSLN